MPLYTFPSPEQEPASSTSLTFGAKMSVREGGGAAAGRGSADRRRRLAGAAERRRTWGTLWREPPWGRAGRAAAAADGMDLAVAAGAAGGTQQHQQLRDEVAEKCQKLFQDFLEE